MTVLKEVGNICSDFWKRQRGPCGPNAYVSAPLVYLPSFLPSFSRPSDFAHFLSSIFVRVRALDRDFVFNVVAGFSVRARCVATT